jgi:hypothetical protein
MEKALNPGGAQSVIQARRNPIKEERITIRRSGTATTLRHVSHFSMTRTPMRIPIPQELVVVRKAMLLHYGSRKEI